MRKGKANAFRWRIAGGVLLVFFGFGAAGDSARPPTVAVHSPPAAASAAGVADAFAAGFSYSEWLRDKRLWSGGGVHPPSGAACLRVGRAAAEGYDDCPPPQKGENRRGSFWRAFSGGVGENARAVLQSLPPGAGDMRGYLIRQGNGGGGDFAFSQWGRERLQDAVSGFADGAAKALAQAAKTLESVRHAEADAQTPFGGRRGQLGASAIGALREGKDGALGWQARLFLGDGAGGNFGLFARTAADSTLWGANAFLDFQQESGEGFWRGGLGAEWRSRFGDVFVNRYFPFGGARPKADGGFLYSRAGFDAEAVVHFPKAEWVSFSGKYYNWRGRFGQSNESGIAYGFKFRPGGLEFDIYADAGSGKLGADFRYRWILAGGKSASAARAPTFDPRAHFFDAVRREHGQRISQTRGDSSANPEMAFSLNTGTEGIIKSQIGTITISPSGLQSQSQSQLQAQYQPAPKEQSPAVRPENTHNVSPTSQFTITMSVRTTVLLTVREAPGSTLRLTPPMPGTVVMQVAQATLAFVAGGGEKAQITLRSGTLSLSLPPQLTSYITADIASENARMPVFGAAFAAVSCAPGDRAALWDLRAHCFSGGGIFNVVALRSAPVATITLFGGGELTAAAHPSSHFALGREGDLLILSFADANIAGALLTATVAASGVLLSPATLFFTVNAVPANMTLDINRGGTLVTAGATLTAATVSASGGFLTAGGEYSYRLQSDGVLANAGVDADGVVTVSAGVVVGFLTATVIADDNHANTEPGTVYVTVRVIDSFALEANDISATVTTRIVSGGTLAVFAAVGGVLPYSYSALSNLPTGVSLADDGRLHLTSSIDIALTVSVTVAANDSQSPAARGTVAVTVVFADPPEITLDIRRGAALIVSGMTLTAATVSASGGHLNSGGEYSYRLQSGGVAAAAGVDAEGVVTVSAGVVVGFLTATVIADDNHANTSPGTVFVTVRVIDSFALGASGVSGTVTTRIVSGGTLALFAAVGGVLPYSYSAVSSLPAGISLADNGRLHLTSAIANALTVSVTVAGNDSQSPAARGTSAVTVVFVNPPEITLDIRRGAALIVSGMTLTAATVSASGGYLNSGGEYSYRLQSGGVLANAGVNAEGVVTVSAGVVVGFLTATVIADDNHANTEPGTVFVTVRVIDSFALEASGVSGTVTTRIVSEGTLALFAAVGGVLPYSYSALSNLPTGVSLADDGRLHLTSAIDNVLTVSVTVAGNDSQTPSARGTSAVTVVFVNPPELTLDIRRGAALIVSGMTLTAATVSASGGFLTAGGDYSYRLQSGGVLAAAGVDAEGVVTVSAGVAVGFLTATVIADDNHLNTSPGTVFVTVRVIDSFALGASGVSGTVTTRIVSEGTLALFAAVGGVLPYSYSAVSNLPTGVSLADDGRLHLTSAIDNALTVSVTVAGNDSQNPAARGTSAITIIFTDPPVLTLDIDRGATLVISGMTLTAATVTASGGYLTVGGDYSYRLESDGVLANAGVNADGVVTVSAGAVVGSLTATVIADDDHANTEPGTVFLTVRVIDSFALAASGISGTVTTRIVSEGTLALFAAVGGVLPYSYSAVSSLPEGISLADNGRLHLTSAIDLPVAVSVTVAGNDSQNPPARGTSAITVVFVNPPDLTLDIRRGAALIVSGMTLTAATVSASGGYLNSEGDYSYRLESDGVLAAAGDNSDGVVSVSAGVAVGFLTATVIAEDNHANTEPGTVFVTVRIINSFAFGASDVSATLTTRIVGTATLARFVAAGGVLPYSYSAVSNLPTGVSLADDGRLHLTSAIDDVLTVSVTVAGNDSQNPSARGTSAVTVVFVNPPVLTLSINRGATLITASRTLTAAVSVSGGYLSSGGAYSLGLAFGGVSATAGFGAGAITILAGTVAGFVRATVFADDDHANTSPATAVFTALITVPLSVGNSAATITAGIPLPPRRFVTVDGARAQVGGRTVFVLRALPGDEDLTRDVDVNLYQCPRGIDCRGEAGAQRDSLFYFGTALEHGDFLFVLLYNYGDEMIVVERSTAFLHVVAPPTVTASGFVLAPTVAARISTLLGTLSVGGGFLLEGRHSLYSDTPGVVVSGNTVSVFVSVTAVITATILADDDNGVSPPASVMFTVSALAYSPFSAENATVTVTAGISLAGGLTADILRSGGNPEQMTIRFADDCPQYMQCGGTAMRENDFYVFSGFPDVSGEFANVVVYENGGATARATALLSVLRPASVTAFYSGTANFYAGISVLLGTASAAGGVLLPGGAGYGYSSDTPGILITGSAAYISVGNTGTVTATVLADDESGETVPGSVVFTVTAASFRPLTVGDVTVSLTAGVLGSRFIPIFPGGGAPPLQTAALDSPVNCIPGMNCLAPSGQSFVLIALGTPDVGTVTNLFEVSDSAEGVTDRATAAVVLESPPPPITARFDAVAALTARTVQLAGTIFAGGGYPDIAGEYSYLASSPLSAEGSLVYVSVNRTGNYNLLVTVSDGGGGAVDLVLPVVLTVDSYPPLRANNVTLTLTALTPIPAGGVSFLLTTSGGGPPVRIHSFGANECLLTAGLHCAPGRNVRVGGEIAAGGLTGTATVAGLFTVVNVVWRDSDSPRVLLSATVIADIRPPRITISLEVEGTSPHSRGLVGIDITASSPRGCCTYFRVDTRNVLYDGLTTFLVQSDISGVDIYTVRLGARDAFGPQTITVTLTFVAGGTGQSDFFEGGRDSPPGEFVFAIAPPGIRQDAVFSPGGKGTGGKDVFWVREFGVSPSPAQQVGGGG